MTTTTTTTTAAVVMMMMMVAGAIMMMIIITITSNTIVTFITLKIFRGAAGGQYRFCVRCRRAISSFPCRSECPTRAKDPVRCRMSSGTMPGLCQDEAATRIRGGPVGIFGQATVGVH